jgi:hypothetical protein
MYPRLGITPLSPNSFSSAPTLFEPSSLYVPHSVNEPLYKQMELQASVNDFTQGIRSLE